MQTLTIRSDMKIRPHLRFWRKMKHEEGHNLVELALVMPMLFAMLLGGIEMGRVAYAAIEIASAARAGVAYGARNSTTASDTNGMQNAATADASDIAAWGTTVNATASQTCQCSDGTTITCANAAAMCLSPARTLVSVQVSAMATVDPLIHAMGLPATYNLGSTVTMRVQ